MTLAGGAYDLCVCKLTGSRLVPLSPATATADEHADVLALLAGRLEPASPAGELRHLLRLGAERLREPMRVAVTGQIKRGKSTLVNALLGQSVAATDAMEATWVTGEYRDAEPVGVTVHYRDGRPPADFLLDQLGRLTARTHAAPAELAGVARVECRVDSDLLRRYRFRIIDTPGFNSVHREDSRNAARSLFGTASRQRPHAVMYLFDKEPSRHDADILRRFLGGGLGPVSPLNAFGVLSRCDEHWPAGSGGRGTTDDDPVRGWGRRAIRVYLDRHRELRSLLHTIVPVSGLVAEGAAGLDDDDLASLDSLVGTPDAWLGWLQFDDRFTADPDIPMPRPVRADLVARLGRWGIYRALQHLGEGAKLPELRTALLDDSGVPEVAALAGGHFGHRARTVKLEQVLREIESHIVALRRDSAATGEAVAGVDDVAETVRDIRRREHGFRELRLLRAYYGGGLDLSGTERDELLRVTGEAGPACATRLGLSDDAGLATMSRLSHERLRFWTSRYNAPGAPAELHAVAADMRDCYDWITLRVDTAAAVLA